MSTPSFLAIGVTIAFPTALPSFALEECLPAPFCGFFSRIRILSHAPSTAYLGSLIVFRFLAIFITISKAYCECPLASMPTCPRRCQVSSNFKVLLRVQSPPVSYFVLSLSCATCVLIS
jgi:hypothetical protein